ncbi:tRNA (adenosine(37)-N6)-dimethylallyltransferase MiaA [Curvibacter sp. HBC28]|uniref:tRNA dimethylallyltransferase n=1 Tax=Curvibacter microcysteis TaxID=3026419 RepID=A0ABT5MNV3_9BURK|nr:tRNA (adenosine(37)-N6)-dimethylallyltransferase MiaA [Curvibacter sp. HBC28]MDD0816886.1 tRNA (adenosine(37)-N6)-dimethylallyltransferase MiaA [Curvibacter sp. HBC28]
MLDHVQAPIPPCLALAGPTASGKTAAALALAQRHRIEIISVDSALVYRGMDVGTAKPTAAELAQVPHHLIDIRDPLQAYSAAEFVQDVLRLMPDIRARGAQPVLVGGTMLYFKALMDGLDPMPAAQPALRAALEAEAAERGWPALHAELAQVDPETAARLAPNDAQRIQRALEVFRATGQTLSHFHAGRAGRATPGLPLVLLTLEPHDRTWLHERIARRFDEMLSQGLVDEVRQLRERGDLNPDLPSMRCVGYRQAWEALDGTLSLAELRERGIFATRQLAKRQLTWLRGMPSRQIVVADAPDALHQVLQAAERVLISQPATPP